MSTNTGDSLLVSGQIEKYGKEDTVHFWLLLLCNLVGDGEGQKQALYQKWLISHAGQRTKAMRVRMIEGMVIGLEL